MRPHQAILKHLKPLFTVYTTTRLVRIRSKCLAITNVTLVVFVWCAFIMSYQLNLKQLYQKSCAVSGVVLTKVKGAVKTERTSEDWNQTTPNLYNRIWDTSDTVFPPHGGANGAFFLLTNIIITPNQSRGVCADPSVLCKNNSDCTAGLTVPSKTGVMTGNCSQDVGNCEVSAWCPIEKDTVKGLNFNGARALLEETKHFTVMVKNTVEFPDCVSVGNENDYQRRNILENTTASYLHRCIYDPNNNPYCPIFRIGDIVNASGEDFSKVALTGGVFKIQINWNCDFDWGSTASNCFPKYSFIRMDDTNPQLSPGFNFRSALHHEDNRRTLTKNYGLKFLIGITGEGQKFDFLKTVLTTGATIGLFALAPLVCDFLFDTFCWLKNCNPFKECLSEFTEDIRYQGVGAHLASVTPSNFAISDRSVISMQHINNLNN